jgi:hypothetical protein
MAVARWRGPQSPIFLKPSSSSVYTIGAAAMPRPASSRVKAYKIEAGSPSLISAMFDLRPDDIADMITKGLPVYTRGCRRRILVDDVKKHLRRWPRVSPKQRSVQNADENHAS